MRVLPNYPNHPPPGRSKFNPLVSMRKVCTKVIIKSSELFHKCIRYVWRNQNKPNSTMKDPETLKAAVGVSNWAGLKPRKTLSLPNGPIFRGARNPIWDDVFKEVKSTVKDDDEKECTSSDDFFSLNYSKLDCVSRKPLEEGQHFNSVSEDVLNDILFEVIEIVDRNEHREAIEKLVEEMFRKAQVSLTEEVSNLHELVDKRSEAYDMKIEDISAKITQLGTATNVIQEDLSELEQSVASVTTKIDQSLGEAEMNKVAINRNTEEIESLKLKALEYEKSFEKMEAIKMDFATNKQKFSEDHNSLVQEVDQVRKKQRVHEARFADIDREVSLLKVQIREEKKEDASSQSLKKDIEQLRSQIVQVEAKLTVKMEQSAPVSPMVSTPKCPQFYSPPTPSSCKGSGKSMQDDQNEAMVIFLNRASIKEIATLPAIGHKTAQLIHNQREMRGKFTSLMQIRNVPGISQTVFNKFLQQNQLTLY